MKGIRAIYRPCSGLLPYTGEEEREMERKQEFRKHTEVNQMAFRFDTLRTMGKGNGEEKERERGKQSCAHDGICTRGSVNARSGRCASRAALLLLE